MRCMLFKHKPLTGCSVGKAHKELSTKNVTARTGVGAVGGAVYLRHARELEKVMSNYFSDSSVA